MNKSIVIIPTTGAPELEQAVLSALDQTIATDVLVVFDGKHFDRPLNLPEDSRISKLVLPFNTGNGRTHAIHQDLPRHWYGARAQIAASYMVNNDYAMVLDQDNWLQPNHVESCIAKIESRTDIELQFVYSLRNIHRKDGTFCCRDNCQSLGKHQGVSGNMLDTSCYFYRTDFLLYTAHMWLWGWGSDRVYMQRILQSFGDQIFDGTGYYTLNYRLGGNDSSVREEFFVLNNAKICGQYDDSNPMPWAQE